jgi:putative acetyltransferase
MHGTMKIRKATKEDIESFKEVIRTSILELCADYYSQEQLEALLSQFPAIEVYEKWINDRLLLVAEEKGNIVGFAQYSPDISLIEAVHVNPLSSKQEIGRKLVRAIEGIALDLGKDKITLESSINAIEFYKKCGYRQIKSSKYKCKNDVDLDVVTFEKQLNS